MYKKSISDLAYDILEKNHRPMHYRKITEEILQIKDIKAENPHHDVNALIGADQRFTKYQRGVWGLVKWKYREAHLSYNLTSYCLRNGTIFLTSYLRPYLNWSRDERDIEVTFVDDEGEEVKGLINYRQRLIFGLKDWYKKKELDVNDTIYLGLIDENKRQYFLIAEKDIRIDSKKDIGDIIFKILQTEGKPLNYSQIYSAIIKQDPEQRGLFDEYIKNILENDSRFAETGDGWGLFEWLGKAEQLHVDLFQRQDIDEFCQTLKEAFNFLGYKTEWDSTQGKEQFTARAYLDYKSYSLLITGLPKNYKIGNINDINWTGLKRSKEEVMTDTVILFADQLSISELAERADEEGVRLFEISILDNIIKEHKKMPFSLFDLRIAFSPMQSPRRNYDKLMEIREKQWEVWKLSKKIIELLTLSGRKDTNMDINLLCRELNSLNKDHTIANNIDELDVKRIISLLSREPWKLIEYTESGNIILAYNSPLVKQKICCIANYCIDIE